ncbi:MAG: hypothetical protein KAK00_05250 [Nanoarchaeota archaeon]|nr:hypothetical protein [Nanoarchaeota archaeon]
MVQKNTIEYGYDGKKPYNFSRYKGKEFLLEYEKSRKEAISKLGNLEIIEENWLNEVILKYYETKKEIDNLSGNIVLSLQFIQNYLKTKDIRYLNACLKANDLICGSLDKINSKMSRKCAFTSISLELKEVKELYKKRGIKIE